MGKDDEREFIEKLRATSIEAAAEVMGGLQRLRDFTDEIADDGTGIPRPRVRDHFYQLAKMELEHAANVMRLGSMQAEMLFEHVRRLARNARGEPPLRVLELVRDGERYVGTFEIRNVFDVPADLRYEYQPFVIEAGETKQVTPAANCKSPLAPHETGCIEVYVTGTFDKVAFGQVDVFLSGRLERRIARRSLKVRPA